MNDIHGLIRLAQILRELGLVCAYLVMVTFICCTLLRLYEALA